MDATKTIVLSFAEADRPIAESLNKVISDWFGDNVWTREFDLNGGEIVTDAIELAVTNANWFILLLSGSAASSHWLSHEARLATVRSIESMDFKFIVVRLENVQYPRQLEIALQTQYTVDLVGISDIEHEFIKIAEYIGQTENTRGDSDVYVDRGEVADKFSLIARRNKIVFILGWAGIGKSAFVTNSIAQKLNKRPLRVSITRGHSLDWLCRDVLKAAHVTQVGLSGIVDQSDDELLENALRAIKLRSSSHFVFLDDAEQALDPDNRMLPYLEKFLTRLIEAELSTHVIITTTRNPDYSALIGTGTDLLQLNGLDNAYISESIELWLEDSDLISTLMKGQDFNELVNLVGGYPLAAKMLASYLRFKSASELLVQNHRKRFQRKLAEYILRATDQTILDELQKLILGVLALVRSPMSLQDIMGVSEIRRHGLDAIQTALSQLSDRFLVEQRGEMMSLHNFILTYYEEQIAHDTARSTQIARSFGRYAHGRLLNLNNQLTELIQSEAPDEANLLKISNEMFRYSIPAARLLRSVGDDQLANQLPIKVSGTLREMVFYFYQEKKNYAKSLEYSEQWLDIYPEDLEIALFRVRCYRNLGDKPSLIMARNLLGKLDSSKNTSRFKARIFREYAIISERLGDIETAKKYYRAGIDVDRDRPYAENHVGLARILFEEAEQLPFGTEQQYSLADEAVTLLEHARTYSVNFDRHHLGLYVQALLEADFEQVALPLLLEALDEQPHDGRVNFRMAEILRNREEFDDADKYAVIAIDSGTSEATMTRANILYSKAIKMGASGDVAGEQKAYKDALALMQQYHPEPPHARRVADTTIAKMSRAIGDWVGVAIAVGKYPNSDDPYMIYEQCRFDIHNAEVKASAGYLVDGKNELTNIIERINTIERHGKIKPNSLAALGDLKRDAEIKLNSMDNVLGPEQTP